MQSIHHQKEFIDAIALAMQQRLSGYVINDAFKVDKNTCILNFKNKTNELFYVKLITVNQTFYFIADNLNIDRSDSVYPLFKDVIQLPFTVYLHYQNRSFEFLFSNQFKLIFKLYGPLANIILFNAKGSVVSSFRNEIENDKYLHADEFKVINPSNNSLNSFKICKCNQQIKLLTQIEPDCDIMFEANDVLVASNYFSKVSLSNNAFVQKKQNLLRELGSKLKKTQSGIIAATEALSKIGTQDSIEQKGHIIMANLHQLQKGMTNATLFDFYNNQLVNIKLKKDLSPLENATYYYKKAKSILSQKVALNQKLNQLQQQEIKLKEKLKLIESATDLKLIKPFIDNEKQKEKTVSKFKIYQYNGFSIWVGKSAANNDELTLKYAHKNDLWLHAKDVSGSHVVIKQQGNKAFTKDVIAYAASIAARYSKAQHSNLVPVSYTLKKYVRKPKGALPGQVVVDKEDVIIVEPIIFNN